MIETFYLKIKRERNLTSDLSRPKEEIVTQNNKLRFTDGERIENIKVQNKYTKRK